MPSKSGADGPSVGEATSLQQEKGQAGDPKSLMWAHLCGLYLENTFALLTRPDQPKSNLKEVNDVKNSAQARSTTIGKIKCIKRGPPWVSAVPASGCHPLSLAPAPHTRCRHEKQQKRVRVGGRWMHHRSPGLSCAAWGHLAGRLSP